jgi:hypothetical protein
MKREEILGLKVNDKLVKLIQNDANSAVLYYIVLDIVERKSNTVYVLRPLYKIDKLNSDNVTVFEPRKEGYSFSEIYREMESSSNNDCYGSLFTLVFNGKKVYILSNVSANFTEDE